MSSPTVSLPVNDSLRVRYSVRTENKTLLSLTGFTVTVVVKASASHAAPPIVTATGVVQSPDTSAVTIIPPNTLATVGTFYATVRAVNATESYSDSFIIQVTDHA